MWAPRKWVILRKNTEECFRVKSFGPSLRSFAALSTLSAFGTFAFIALLLVAALEVRRDFLEGDGFLMMGQAVVVSSSAWGAVRPQDVAGVHLRAIGIAAPSLGVEELTELCLLALWWGSTCVGQEVLRALNSVEPRHERNSSGKWPTVLAF